MTHPESGNSGNYRQYNIRLGPEVGTALRRLAALEGVSVSQYIQEAVESHLINHLELPDESSPVDIERAALLCDKEVIERRLGEIALQ